MKRIQTRADLVGVNTFSRQYGLSRMETMRIILRSQVDAIFIPDGKRYYIDVAAILLEAKREGIKATELVRRYARQSKR